MFEQLGESKGFRLGKLFLGIIAALIVVALIATGGFYGVKWFHNRHHGKPAAAIRANHANNKGTGTPAAQQPQTEQVTFQPGWYKLQPGDMLSELALRAYGHADWSPIVRANPGLPHNLRTIRAGWWIYIPCAPCTTATAKNDPAPAPSATKHAAAAAATAKASKTSRSLSDTLAALKRSTAKTAAGLILTMPALQTEIDDPPLTSMANLPTMEPVMETEERTVTDLVSSEMRVHLAETVYTPVKRRHARTPKGYAVVLPSGMTPALVNRHLPTRVYLFEPGERIAASQHRIGDSEVKVQNGHFVLYVPFRSLPSGTFNLAVAGISAPVTGAFFRKNATPVYKHFPVSSHRIEHFLFGTGQSAAAGAIVYLAWGGGPIPGLAAFGATAVFHLIKNGHEKSVAKTEEAARNAAFNANIDAERAEQQQAALTSPSRGQAP